MQYFSDHSLIEVLIDGKNLKCKSAYWHFNASLLSDLAVKDIFQFFFGEPTGKLNTSMFPYSSGGEVGKAKIKQLCLQYTVNITKDMTRSLRALEREVVELQSSTGERKHIEVFKSKKAALSDLLSISACCALVRSRFQAIVKMDVPSRFFGGAWSRSLVRRS